MMVQLRSAMAAVALVCGFAGNLMAAESITLRVASYGGSFTESQQKYVGDLFERRTGNKIEWIDGNPTDHLAKMIASKGREAPFDVLYSDEYIQDAAAQAGVIEKIDLADVPNAKYLYDQALSRQGYGPAFDFWSVGIVYNKEILAQNGIEPPTSWQDLWNPKFAGKIALPDITQSSAKDLIIATARLAGGDEGKIGDAFERLAQIQPYYYYRSSADLESKLIAGEVWVTVWNNGRPGTMVDKGMPLEYINPKEGGAGHVATIDVIKGTPHLKEALEFVNLSLDPLNQIGLAYEYRGPTHKLVAPLLAAYPNLAKFSPTTPEDLKKLYIADPAVVNAQYSQWVDSWNRVTKN